jgi:phosphoglycerate dehydrogenase-like enzyme
VRAANRIDSASRRQWLRGDNCSVRRHQDNNMRLGIIGAGYIGRALAALAKTHGDIAMISNSRGP